jgi:L-alanine-DL-glutamate epimerase-like enolase superfamily enzyme
VSQKGAPIERVVARAFRVPTDSLEEDGTLAWDATTLILAEVSGGGQTGLGYTYASPAACGVVKEVLAGKITGQDAFDIPRLWAVMVSAVRNLGRQGICACAISAADCALWDLKAKVTGLPAVQLMGAARSEIPIYGSGGFTNYSDKQLTEQLSGFIEHSGCRAVKMKVGRASGRRAVRSVRRNSTSTRMAR